MAPSIKNVSTAALLAEMQRREKILPRLRRQRNRLATELDRLDAQIASLDGMPGVRRGPGRPPKSAAIVVPARRRRARNKLNLVDALVGAMKPDTPMAIGEIMDAVQKRGYKSTSNQFRNIVTQRLSADKRFKRTGRGQYARVG